MLGGKEQQNVEKGVRKGYKTFVSQSQLYYGFFPQDGGVQPSVIEMAKPLNKQIE